MSKLVKASRVILTT